jgi:hypothetical protein
MPVVRRVLWLYVWRQDECSMSFELSAQIAADFETEEN